MAKTESQLSKFTFYPTSTNPISITANPLSGLYDEINAAESDKLKKFSFSDSILFAELSDQTDFVAVLPNLPCKEIKRNGKVQAKSKKGATPCNKENEAPSKNRDIFYVKSNSRGITKIPNSSYDGKLLAVVAKPEDSLGEAIIGDGRFCEEFILLQDNDRQSDVPLKYKVSDYSREVFIMKKRAPKRKSTNTPTTSEEPNLSKSYNKNPNSKSVYSKMPTTVEEKLTDEIRKTMIDDAREAALKTFVDPTVGTDQLDKRIQSVAQKFGRVSSCAIPARVLRNLAEATESVGLVKCGDCTGSCILLQEKVIITCQHVINDINAKRSESTNKELHKTISVYLDFTVSHELGICYGQVDEAHIYTGDGKLDYAICFINLANPAMTDPKPLGPLVRSALPHSGLVILVGHPDSDYKKAENCRILPGYNWHSTLCKRASDAEQYCREHPEECMVSSDNTNESCVHIWKARALQGDHPDQLPYDTSFFHGSSGSPVFNCDGHIVAMHTQGYPFYQGSKKVSLMEFGVTFAAICRDVIQRYSQYFAHYLFPEECM